MSRKGKLETELQNLDKEIKTQQDMLEGLAVLFKKDSEKYEDLLKSQAEIEIFVVSLDLLK